MRRFVEHLRMTGPLSRAELTRLTSVSSATSSSIIATLLEEGVIEEQATMVNTTGRPAKIFQLARNTRCAVGISIEMEATRIAFAGLEGKVEPQNTLEFPATTNYRSLLSQIERSIESLHQNASCTPVGIGVSVPGLVDRQKGEVAYCPHLPFLEGHTLRQDLARLFGADIYFFQENHGLSLAERAFGQAGEYANFIVVDVSKGVGASIVIDGRHLQGQSGFTGEIGHMTVVPDGEICACGNRGCLETVACEGAFVQSVSKRLGTGISLNDIARLVGEGLLSVDEELITLMEYLSIGIAAMINLLNPEAIIVHGAIFDISPRCLELLQGAVERRALRPLSHQCKIERSVSDKLHGAIAGVLEEYFSTIGPTLD